MHDGPRFQHSIRGAVEAPSIKTIKKVIRFLTFYTYASVTHAIVGVVINNWLSIGTALPCGRHRTDTPRYDARHDVGFRFLIYISYLLVYRNKRQVSEQHDAANPACLSVSCRNRTSLLLQ